ncbi:MAG: bactofilin family protein [Ktedonobacteraceae bacterium]
MRKVSVGQWAMLIIGGLALLTTFLIGGGGQLLSWISPPAEAASVTQSASHHFSGIQQHCTEEHLGPSFGGAVVVDTNTVVCSTLTVFGGTVAINGTVIGDVVSFGSAVVIAGTVNGNIDVYGGSVVLRTGSRLYGNINLYAGHWTRGQGVQFVGAVSDHTRKINWLFPGEGPFSFPLLPLITWVALGLFLTTLLPEHVMIVRTTVSSKSRRSLMIGLLSIVLAPPLLIVLIALILSIPVAIIVALGLIAGWALGTVAIGWLVGEHILRTIAPQKNTRPVQIAVGMTAIVLVGSIPFIGWIISIGVGLLGVGAVFLSRFGTRLYVQPRQPLTM